MDVSCFRLSLLRMMEVNIRLTFMMEDEGQQLLVSKVENSLRLPWKKRKQKNKN